MGTIVGRFLTSGREREAGVLGRGLETLLLLGLCAAVQVGLSPLLLDRGFLALGDDDFFKLVAASDWARNPTFAPNPVWLPLEFWLPGMACLVFKNPFLATVVLNLTFSLGGLFLLYALARRLGGDETATWSLVLLATFPWHVWTGITGQTEAVFQL